MPVAGKEETYTEVILPAGGSATGTVGGNFDTLGGYEGYVNPIPSIYEDYQINCYRYYDVKDNNPPKYNSNALTADEVNKIYEWVAEQDGKNNFPDVSEKIITVECTSLQPYIRYVDESKNIVCYVVPFRVWYVNEVRKQKQVYYEL